MTPDGLIQPKTAARRLRTALRAAREKAGLTQESVADALGWSPSKVMRMERGTVSVGETDLERIADLYDLTQAQRSRLIEYSETAKQRAWWHDFRDFGPVEFTEYIGHESEASEIQLYNHYMIPGLCQTTDYMRAVMRSGQEIIDYGDERVIGALRVRVARQQRLLNAESGPHICVAIDESALYRQAADASVMADQLLWLAELSRRPQVDIRILTFDMAGHGYMHAFTLLKFADGDPDVLYREASIAGSSLSLAEHRSEVAVHAAMFERLWARCLDAKRTNHLLHHVAEQYRSGGSARPWL